MPLLAHLIRFADRLHVASRRLVPLHRLVIISRILLAIAFVPTGMVKLLGERFTQLPTSNPVGAIFEAFYQTGFYWRFLGLGQVTAALLLLIPATTTLGAVAFFPIIVNIAVLTWAVQFKGTTIITALMVLANLLLLAWDYDRWRSLLTTEPAPLTTHPHHPLPTIERVGYVLGTSAGMVFFLGTRSFGTRNTMVAAVLLGLLAVLLVTAGWVQHWRASRAPMPSPTQSS
jgi:uncharacterized membrane protein YphA (DoxX/SURF4 family)